MCEVRTHHLGRVTASCLQCPSPLSSWLLSQSLLVPNPVGGPPPQPLCSQKRWGGVPTPFWDPPQRAQLSSPFPERTALWGFLREAASSTPLSSSACPKVPSSIGHSDHWPARCPQPGAWVWTGLSGEASPEAVADSPLLNVTPLPLVLARKPPPADLPHLTGGSGSTLPTHLPISQGLQVQQSSCRGTWDREQ